MCTHHFIFLIIMSVLNLFQQIDLIPKKKYDRIDTKIVFLPWEQAPVNKIIFPSFFQFDPCFNLYRDLNRFKMSAPIRKMFVK